MRSVVDNIYTKFLANYTDIALKNTSFKEKSLPQTSIVYIYPTRLVQNVRFTTLVERIGR